MKKLIAALTLVSGLSSTAFGSYAGPILVKAQDAGYTPPEHHYAKQCEIYLNKVVKIARFGGEGSALVKEERPISLEASVLSLIETAQAGPFKEEVGPTDIPGTAIYGYKILPNDAIEKVLLFQVGSGSSVTNENPAQVTLVNIVRHLCD
ncbi:MAG: hypothetical protein AB7T49_10065 [Oligoflexales bacterium]